MNVDFEVSVRVYARSQEGLNWECPEGERFQNIMTNYRYLVTKFNLDIQSYLVFS